MENMNINMSTMIKLSASNYSIWKPMMEDVLYYKDLHDLIEGDSVKPSKMSNKDWEKLNRKTIGCIRQCIDVSVFHHVSQKTNAEALWEKSKGLYERKTAQNKAFMARKLVNLKLKEGRSVAEHFSKFQDLVNQMITMKLIIDDGLQVLLRLSSLPDSWENLVVSLRNSAPNGVLQLAMVKDSLFKETRRKDMGKDNAQALVTGNRGRSKTRNFKGCGKSISQLELKGKFKCFYYDKEGHIRRNCKAWKNKQKNEKNHNRAEEQNTTAVLTIEEVVLSIGEDECWNVSHPYVEWVIDSASSCYVTPRNELFTSYKAGDFGRVRMGNNSYANIVRTGDICVKTNTGCTLELNNTRHVLDMCLNMIFTHILVKEGYGKYFGDSKWRLSKGSSVLVRWKICCTLYKTQVKMCKDVVSAT